jgi:hypothetical protein
MLGGLALVLLAIIGGQAKLFVSTPKSDLSGPGGTANTVTTANVGAAKLSAEDASAPPKVLQSVPVSAAPVKKAAPKIARPAAKPIVVPLSTLELAVQHQFKDATLYVWVDDKLELTLPLHGAAQKKLVVFNGVRGVTSQTMKVPAGKRMLRFRALSTDQTVDLSKTLSAEFVGGDTKSLAISFEKHNSAIRLNWE